MVARLSRIVPLLIVLAVVAGIVYLVAAWRYSPNRGKEILIRLFTWLTGALSVVFLLISLYALLDGNALILDLGASFLVAALIGLGITRICRAVFVRNHPGWKQKPVRTTHPDDHPRRPSTRAMRTEFTFSSAFEGNPSNVHHTAVKSPLKSNVRCSTACSDPSVSACAVMSTFVMS